MYKFTDFNLSPELLKALEHMNYAEPTPVQKQAIPVALDGRDLIASAQTGTGKTAAFGIPLISMLLKQPQAQALVLAPTRELAAQIVAVMRELSSQTRRMETALLIGGVGMGQQFRALRLRPRIIVATPGRLVDHLRDKRSLLADVKFLVLDEADRMLDLGFAPQLRIIRAALPLKRQTLLFSATFPIDIAELAREWLINPERVTIGSVSRPIEKIDQSLIEVQSNRKNGVVLRELEQRRGSVLVFARTKRRTDRLAIFLKEQGVSVCRIHGDRSQNQRDEALSGFRRGKFRVLVATDIAARGIDVPEIEHVINYDLPYVAEDYLHRIGRTARAGRSGQALCLMDPEERPLWRAIERLMSRKNGVHSSERARFNLPGSRRRNSG